jgi:hypothetical protein
MTVKFRWSLKSQKAGGKVKDQTITPLPGMDIGLDQYLFTENQCQVNHNNQVQSNRKRRKTE